MRVPGYKQQNDTDAKRSENQGLIKTLYSPFTICFMPLFVLCSLSAGVDIKERKRYAPDMIPVQRLQPRSILL